MNWLRIDYLHNGIQSSILSLVWGRSISHDESISMHRIIWWKIAMWFFTAGSCRHVAGALTSKIPACSATSVNSLKRFMSMTGSSPLESVTLPAMRLRNMVALPTVGGRGSSQATIGSLRVQQFNILADGLSGLRPDLGSFSRISKEHLQWKDRRYKLLHEIVQYNPDVVTLQECDHFHDFFLPEMQSLGYCGYFAPKSTSTCLEVSDVSDGCAIFVRQSKLDVVTSETLTYAVRRSDVQDALRHFRDVASVPNKLNIDDVTLLSQNQVALILCVYLRDIPAPTTTSTDGTSTAVTLKRIPVVIGTTHLKASKTAEGEIIRLLQSRQLMDAILRNIHAIQSTSGDIEPAVLLTGDLNAIPEDRSETFDFDCAVYQYLTSHAELPLRSVLNDDFVQRICQQDGVPHEQAKKKIWTTWKARKRGDETSELIVKHCIDYILYRPPPPLPPPLLQQQQRTKGVALMASAVSELFTDDEVGDALLPSASYPSDHLSIVADFDVVHTYPSP